MAQVGRVPPSKTKVVIKQVQFRESENNETEQKERQLVRETRSLSFVFSVNTFTLSCIHWSDMETPHFNDLQNSFYIKKCYIHNQAFNNFRI